MFKQMLVCNERMRVVELLRSYYAHVTAPIKVCRECTSSTSSLPSFQRHCILYADLILTRVTVEDPWWLMRVATAPSLVWSHGAQDVLTLIILGYTPGDDTTLNSSECKISFYLFLCYFLVDASSCLQGDKSALLDSGAHQWHHLPCPILWVEDHCPEFICKQLL